MFGRQSATTRSSNEYVVAYFAILGEVAVVREVDGA